MSRIRLATLGFCSLLAVRALGAQRVLGPWDDASTLRGGALRLSLGVAWDRANERYDADGKLHPLGAAASAASWNGAYDARLGVASPLVSTLSGLSSFDASLGVLAIGRRDASTDVPVALEVGLLSRLTIGASARVVNHGIEPGVSINPGRVEGTMGFNPAWTNTAAAGRNGTLVTQFDSATAQMTRRIAQCQAAPATAGCTSINTNVAGAQALVTNARTFADALNQLYGGRPTSVGLPFVPVGGTAAQKAIDQRVLGFRDQFTALGNGAIAGDGPAPAARFAQDDITRLLTDSAMGYLLRPLRHVSAYGLAELTVSAKLRLFDGTGDDTTTLRGPHVRQSVGASLHLGGADEPKGDEVFAPTAGSIGKGASARSYTDIFYGRRFAASVVIGAEMSQDERFDMRLAAADAPAVGGVPFPMQLASRAVRITRSPGTRIDATLTPRFAVTRAFWIGASYRYAQQGADSWSISSKPAGGTATAQDATHWAGGTDWTEQRLSLGATYSTLAAARAGKTRRAFDVSYQYEQVLLGSGWRVPKLTRDVVTVRWYQSLWGRQAR